MSLPRLYIFLFLLVDKVKVDLLESVLLVLKVIRAGLFLNLNWFPKEHEIDEINRGVFVKKLG